MFMPLYPFNKDTTPTTNHHLIPSTPPPPSRKPDRSEEEELSSACPYCSYDLPNSLLTCTSCKNNIPFCIASVRLWLSFFFVLFLVISFVVFLIFLYLFLSVFVCLCSIYNFMFIFCFKQKIFLFFLYRLCMFYFTFGIRTSFLNIYFFIQIEYIFTILFFLNIQRL